MNKLYFYISILILISSSISSLELLSCTCLGDSDISSINHKTYDVIFEGKLIKKSIKSIKGEELYSGSENNFDTTEINNTLYYVYTFQINTVYKPLMLNNIFIDVYSLVTSGSCGINLSLGKNYIVTADYNLIEPIFKFNPDMLISTDKKSLHLETNICMHTKESNDADIIKLDSLFYRKVEIKREVILNK